jgi:hypothetical protein
MERILINYNELEENYLIRFEAIPAMVNTTYPSTSVWLSYEQAQDLISQLQNLFLQQTIERNKK